MSFAEKMLLWAVIPSMLGGCGYATKGYRYQGVALPPREARCSLEIFTAPPTKKVVSKEVGVVEFTPRALGGFPATEQEAREKAYDYACMAGGNGILVTPDRDGVFSKATILRVEKKIESKR